MWVGAGGSSGGGGAGGWCMVFDGWKNIIQQKQKMVGG